MPLVCYMTPHEIKELISEAVKVIKQYLADFAWDYTYMEFMDVGEYRNASMFTCQELIRIVKEHPDEDPYKVVERYKEQMNSLSTNINSSQDMKWRFSVACNTAEDVLSLIEYERLKQEGWQ